MGDGTHGVHERKAYVHMHTQTYAGTRKTIFWIYDIRLAHSAEWKGIAKDRRANAFPIWQATHERDEYTKSGGA
jgi:hypothetical protein